MRHVWTSIVDFTDGPLKSIIISLALFLIIFFFRRFVTKFDKFQDEVKDNFKDYGNRIDNIKDDFHERIDQTEKNLGIHKDHVHDMSKGITDASANLKVEMASFKEEFNAKIMKFMSSVEDVKTIAISLSDKNEIIKEDIEWKFKTVDDIEKRMSEVEDEIKKIEKLEHNLREKADKIYMVDSVKEQVDILKKRIPNYNTAFEKIAVALKNHREELQILRQRLAKLEKNSKIA